MMISDIHSCRQARPANSVSMQQLIMCIEENDREYIPDRGQVRQLSTRKLMPEECGIRQGLSDTIEIRELIMLDLKEVREGRSEKNA